VQRSSAPTRGLPRHRLQTSKRASRARRGRWNHFRDSIDAEIGGGRVGRDNRASRYRSREPRWGAIATGQLGRRRRSPHRRQRRPSTTPLCERRQLLSANAVQDSRRPPQGRSDAAVGDPRGITAPPDRALHCRKATASVQSDRLDQRVERSIHCSVPTRSRWCVRNNVRHRPGFTRGDGRSPTAWPGDGLDDSDPPVPARSAILRRTRPGSRPSPAAPGDQAGLTESIRTSAAASFGGPRLPRGITHSSAKDPQCGEQRARVLCVVDGRPSATGRPGAF